MKSKNKATNTKITLPRIIIGLLSLAGLGIMIYLTYIHFAEASSFCDLSETVSCDVVTTSIYSEIFGIPVSIMGLGYFALTLLLTLFGKGKGIFQAIFFLTLFVLIPSYYLTALEAFVIKAFCILCEASKLLMLAILVTSFTAMKQKISFVSRMAIPVVLAGFVSVGIIFFAQNATTTTKDLTPLIEALNEKGVVYYKSVKCTNCIRQEKLLGEAYKKLNQVECHPDGVNPQVELCLEKKIDHTPTFIIESSGIEVERIIGLQSLENLADFAGVPVSILEE